MTILILKSIFDNSIVEKTSIKKLFFSSNTSVVHSLSEFLASRLCVHVKSLLKSRALSYLVTRGKENNLCSPREPHDLICL